MPEKEYHRVEIPSIEIRRVAWSPLTRRRWSVIVSRGPVSYHGYARWRWQASDMAIDWAWTQIGPREAMTREEQA